MDKRSRIFVAGHRGLVGSSLMKVLEKKGYTNLLAAPRVSLDLTDFNETRSYFMWNEPEYIFLAAAKVGGIKANAESPADFIYKNLMIQSNVIEIAREFGVKKLLFLGSSCIYPKHCAQPMKEEYLMTGPLEPTNDAYAVAKIAGLKMIEAYNKQYGTDFISVMPTNLYGESDNFDLDSAHMLAATIRKFHLGKLLREENFGDIRMDLRLSYATPIAEIRERLAHYGISADSITVWGTGTPRREFMHADDLAEACVHLMEREEDLPYPYVNIGTGEDHTIRRLAELVKSVVGYKGDLVFDTGKPDGMPRKLLDVGRIHSLGWKHRIDIEDGIEQVYQQYLTRNLK